MHNGIHIPVLGARLDNGSLWSSNSRAKLAITHIPVKRYSYILSENTINHKKQRIRHFPGSFGIKGGRFDVQTLG